MEIVLKDLDGNDILYPTVMQWDQGVPIMIRDFYYPLDDQYPYLHFYNTTKQQIYAIGEKTKGNKLIVDADNHTLSCEIPNQLLMETYPITVHVYLIRGGEALSTDSHVEAQTVFTATISVEPRMKPDAYAENDNAGEMTSRYMQELFQSEMDSFKDQLTSFYGTKSTPTVESCYFDPLAGTTGKMYSTRTPVISYDPATGVEITVYEYSDEITGTPGIIYQDAATGVQYFYNANNDTHPWVEWSVTGIMEYAKDRADACDAISQATEAAYEHALDVKEIAINADFAEALDGCIIRVFDHIPSISEFGDEDRPVITFVI